MNQIKRKIKKKSSPQQALKSKRFVVTSGRQSEDLTYTSRLGSRQSSNWHTRGELTKKGCEVETSTGNPERLPRQKALPFFSKPSLFSLYNLFTSTHTHTWNTMTSEITSGHKLRTHSTPSAGFPGYVTFSCCLLMSNRKTPGTVTALSSESFLLGVQ